MINAGKAWLCTSCGTKQWVAKDALNPVLGKQCRAEYKGKDTWVKDLMKKCAPARTGFFQARNQATEAPAGSIGQELANAGRASSQSQVSGTGLVADSYIIRLMDKILHYPL